MKDQVSLTEGERRLLSLVASGLSDGEIGSILNKTEEDVVSAVDGLLAKTRTQTRLELALFALSEFQR